MDNTTNETTERTPRYTMSDIAVMDIVERAVQYGVEKLNQKSALAIQYGCVWLDGWIAAHNSLTEDDITSLRATINHYYFID